MPSEPRPLPRTSRIRVRHENGAEKDVLRSQLTQLSPRWSVVSGRKKKRPPTPVVETSTEPTAESGTEKEE